MDSLFLSPLPLLPSRMLNGNENLGSRLGNRKNQEMIVEGSTVRVCQGSVLTENQK